MSGRRGPERHLIPLLAQPTRAISKKQRQSLLKRRVRRYGGREIKIASVSVKGIVTARDQDGEWVRIPGELLLGGDDKRASSMTFHRRLRDLGYDSYADYLRSEHWAATKARYAASALPKGCWVCGHCPADLHHRTYARLGREHLPDLLPLCRKHHQQTHEHEAVIGVDLWNAARAVKSRYAKGAE